MKIHKAKLAINYRSKALCIGSQF